MNIQQFVQEFALLAPPLLLSLTMHELAHGLVAYRLGDPTAKQLGRLTLNPLKHLDLLGTIAFFIMKIGWAKPVPVNASYFKNPRRDMMWVALAGAGANFLLAVASGILARLVVNAINIIPSFFLIPLAQMIAASVWINVMLGFFNLLPIPPLDGAKVLEGLLPSGFAVNFRRLESFGFIILLVLFYTGIIPRLLMPLINFANNLILP